MPTPTQHMVRTLINWRRGQRAEKARSVVPCAPRLRPPGFTLIELLVVIAIMGLVAGGVVMVYDNVQQRAELSVAQQQLATVREALLRFRVDMGYFPGEGPLSPTALYLEEFRYVDGSETPAAAVRQLWASHPMNLWMLFEKPLALENPMRWDWNPAVARGWQGPYLGQGMGARLDAAGRDPSSGFLGGTLYNRLYAVTDLIGGSSSDATMLRWVTEDREVTAPGQPTLPLGGRPIAFLADDQSLPGWIIYRLVSAGADGIFQTITTPAGDDIVIEVSRRKL